MAHVLMKCLCWQQPCSAVMYVAPKRLHFHEPHLEEFVHDALACVALLHASHMQIVL